VCSQEVPQRVVDFFEPSLAFFQKAPPHLLDRSDFTKVTPVILHRLITVSYLGLSHYGLRTRCISMLVALERLYLRESVLEVVLQKSIPTQIR